MDIGLQLSEESMAILQEIRDGVHPEIVRQKKKLNLIKEKKIAAADAHRKLLIQNANNLYSYEVFESNKLFEKDCTDHIERLIADLCKEATSKVEQAKIDTNIRAQRSLRSAQPLLRPAIKDGAQTEAANGASTKKRGFEKTLPEEDIRFDFHCIVRDLELRSQKFVSNEMKQRTSSSLKIGVGEDFFSVGRDTFVVGSFVSIYSSLSQETLHGIIISISTNSVVLRAGSGTRFSFQFDHLRSGRVTISSSHECNQNSDIINESSRMLIIN